MFPTEACRSLRPRPPTSSTLRSRPYFQSLSANLYTPVFVGRRHRDRHRSLRNGPTTPSVFKLSVRDWWRPG